MFHGCIHRSPSLITFVVRPPPSPHSMRSFGGSFIMKKYSLPRAYAPATASASAPKFGQLTGNRRPGAVWPANRALFYIVLVIAGEAHAM